LRFALAIPVVIVAALLVAMNVTSADQLQSFVLQNRPDVDAVVDVAALRENPVYFLLSATVVSFVLGGLREELWRAGVIAGIRRLWPAVFGSTIGGLGASLIAAVAFGLGHLSQGPLATVLTGMLGFGLGAIMIAHRSIWPAVIAHGSFNAASMALIPWVMQQVG
jgi:membrane protease YdiL (CAAX protease family)